MTIVIHSRRRKNASIPYRNNPALPGACAEHNRIGIVCHVQLSTTKRDDAAVARPGTGLSVLGMRCRTGQVLAEFEPLRKRATE